MTQQIRNLMLTGGPPSHAFEETAPFVARLLERRGIATEIAFDVEGGLARLKAQTFDLLTVHCLRWSMTQHEKYEPDRPRWQFSLTARQRATITAHVVRGGGLLGLHTACISFDDWPEWRDVLGVAWHWGRSHHPPIGPIEVRARGDHAITQGVDPFTVTDELYSDLDMGRQGQVIAQARLAGGESWQPVAIASEGQGRRVFIALGHDVNAMAAPSHVRLIEQAALWAAQRPVGTC